MRFSLSMFPVDGRGRRDPLAELIEEIHREGLSVRVRGGRTLVEGARREVEEAVARAERRIRSQEGDRRFALLLMESSAKPSESPEGEGRGGAATILRRPSRN
jgi:uncharacterized protein YqgV (UPF0045/DUF77 family)